MEQLILEAMKLVREFARKSFETPLTEYEAMAYEQACTMIEGFSKLHTLYYQKAILEAERDLEKERQVHEKWLKGESNDPGAGSAPVS